MANQPFGDVFAKVRGDKSGETGRDRGDRLVKCGAVWSTDGGHLEFTLESEPVAWRKKQPGFAFPQSLSFIVIERGLGRDDEGAR